MTELESIADLKRWAIHRPGFEERNLVCEIANRIQEEVDMMARENDGQTNLEWLYKNELDTLIDYLDCDDCDRCRASGFCQGVCKVDYLLSPHVDKAMYPDVQGSPDEAPKSDDWRHRYDGPCTNFEPKGTGAHSTTGEAQSTNGASLSEKPVGTLGRLADVDDCGRIADMSEKSADCVRLGAENVRETPIFAEKSQKTGEQRQEMTANDDEGDTREKLLADMFFEFKRYSDSYEHLWGLAHGWLERQEVITRRSESEAWRMAATGPIYEANAERDRAKARADELVGQVDALTAENRALKAELRVARGEVKTVLNNCEEAKLKAEREREKYQRMMEVPPEQAWKDAVEREKSQADYWKKLYGDLNDRLMDARRVLDRTKHYTLVDEKGKCV